MTDYTPSEIVDMLLILGECRENYEAAAKLYHKRYPNRLHPTDTVIQNFLLSARQGDFYTNRNRSGSPDLTTSVVLDKAMSSQDDEPSSQNNNTHADRVVTDSVHARFRAVQVHCNICNLDIVGNSTAIEKHFDSSHPSTEYCYYCRGKVFRYTQIPIDGSSDEEPQKFVYHKCRNS